METAEGLIDDDCAHTAVGLLVAVGIPDREHQAKQMNVSFCYSDSLKCSLSLSFSGLYKWPMFFRVVLGLVLASTSLQIGRTKYIRKAFYSLCLQLFWFPFVSVETSSTVCIEYRHVK